MGFSQRLPGFPSRENGIPAVRRVTNNRFLLRIERISVTSVVGCTGTGPAEVNRIPHDVLVALSGIGLFAKPLSVTPLAEGEHRGDELRRSAFLGQVDLKGPWGFDHRADITGFLKLREQPFPEFGV